VDKQALPRVGKRQKLDSSAVPELVDLSYGFEKNTIDEEILVKNNRESRSKAKSVEVKGHKGGKVCVINS